MKLLPGEDVFSSSRFTVGQRVKWRRVQPGGYGLVEVIPGTVKRVGPRLVTIEIVLRDGCAATRSVHPGKLVAAEESDR